VSDNESSHFTCTTDYTDVAIGE